MGLHEVESIQIDGRGKFYRGEYRFNGKLYLYRFPIITTQYVGSGQTLDEARVNAVKVLEHHLKRVVEKKAYNRHEGYENSAAEDILDDMHDSW